MRGLTLLLSTVVACSSPSPEPSPELSPEPIPVQPTVPAALVVVFSGQEIFVGNDQYEPDPAARYKGAFAALERAFSKHPPAAALPTGSQGAVIAYATDTEVVVGMGDIARVDAGLFRDQRPYRGRVGQELVRGTRHGLDLLAKVDARRRILIVIGDGNDTDNELARTRFEAMIPEIAQLRVKVAMIVVRGASETAQLHSEGPLGHTYYISGAEGVAEVLAKALAL
jgi:hypothetical protein